MFSNFEDFKNLGKETFETTEIPKAILDHCEKEIPKDKFTIVFGKKEGDAHGKKIRQSKEIQQEM